MSVNSKRSGIGIWRKENMTDEKLIALIKKNRSRALPQPLTCTAARSEPYAALYLKTERILKRLYRRCFISCGNMPETITAGGHSKAIYTA